MIGLRTSSAGPTPPSPRSAPASVTSRRWTWCGPRSNSQGFILEQIARKRAQPPTEDVLSSLVHAELGDDETDGLEAGVRADVERSRDRQHRAPSSPSRATRPRPTCSASSWALFAAWPSGGGACRRSRRSSPRSSRKGCGGRRRAWSTSGARRAPSTSRGPTRPRGPTCCSPTWPRTIYERVFPDPERFDPERPNLAGAPRVRAGDPLLSRRLAGSAAGAGLLEELTAAVDRGRGRRSVALRLVSCSYSCAARHPLRPPPRGRDGR